MRASVHEIPIDKVSFQKTRESFTRETVYAVSWSTRMRGMLARPRIYWHTRQLLISPCRALHTIGMRYAIDAAFIDRYGQVIAVVRDMPPFRIAVGPSGTYAVLERPSEKEQWIQVGDILKGDMNEALSTL